MNHPLIFSDLAEQLEFNCDGFPKLICAPENQSLEESIAWIRHNQSDIESALTQTGAILFRGFKINTPESFDDFSAAFGYPHFTYKESLSNAVRINFTERVFTANEAPKEVEIFLHHEMAQTPISPDKLFFYCQTAAESGGATPLCRSDQLFSALKKADSELAEKFSNKGVKYTTHMPCANNQQSGQGRSWKNTLSVETVEQAETKLSDLGYQWQWQDDGSLKATSPILPAVKTLNDGVEVFYNQLIAAYLGWQGVKQNPSKAICFGDDQPISIEALDLIVELAKDFTYDLMWQDGDVALVDNKLAMHGRRPYDGNTKRQVLVVLAA